MIALYALVLAAPCAPAAADDRPLGGPAELSVRESDLGAPRSPCAERSLFLHLRTPLAIDYPAFYGTLAASAQIGLRWPLGPIEGSLALRVIDWRFVQNASLTASELGFGPLVVGALVPLSLTLGQHQLALAPSLRLFVPGTDRTYDQPTGAIEAALHAALRARSWLGWHASTSLYAWAVAPPGTVDSRSALAASAGASLTPRRWFAAELGLEVETGWYGWGGLDHVLARLGLRLVSRRAGSFELGALAPVAGAERTNLVIGLAWSLPL